MPILPTKLKLIVRHGENFDTVNVITLAVSTIAFYRQRILYAASNSNLLVAISNGNRVSISPITTSHAATYRRLLGSPKKNSPTQRIRITRVARCKNILHVVESYTFNLLRIQIVFMVYALYIPRITSAIFALIKKVALMNKFLSDTSYTVFVATRRA